MTTLYKRSKIFRVKMKGGFNSFIDTYLNPEYMGTTIELEFRKFFRREGVCLIPSQMSTIGKKISFYKD